MKLLPTFTKMGGSGLPLFYYRERIHHITALLRTVSKRFNAKWLADNLHTHKGITNDTN